MPFLRKEGVAMDIANEVNQEIQQNYGHCKSCKSDFIFKPDEVWYDDKGLGYSTKLTKCPYCGKIVVLDYIEDCGLDVNKDKRFYQ